MSELNTRKLPPIGRNNENNASDQQQFARKKKRRREVGEDNAQELRPRSNSRSGARTLPSPRTQTHSEYEDVEEVTEAVQRNTAKSDRVRSASGRRRVKKGSPTPAEERGVNRVKKASNLKPAEDITTSREPLVEDDAINGLQDEKPKKRKKKRKPRKTEPEESEIEVEQFGLAAELHGLGEDVTVAEQVGEPDIDKAISSAPALRSEPMTKIYIEQRSGFKGTDKGKIARKRAEEEERQLKLDMMQPTSLTTIQLGLATHKIFKTFSLFCHGILAGFALWHIIAVYSLTNVSTDYKEFLRFYSPVAMPVQSLYFLLLVICTVSVFDRYDIGRPTKREVLRCITLQSGAVSTLVYFTSLVISLSIAAIDDKIGLYTRDIATPAPYPTPLWNQGDENELDMWRILNLLRGLGAILGWIIISINPTTDRLTKNLMSADENIIGDMSPDLVRSSGV